MEQQTIEKLIERYSTYENSREFILACIELFSYMDNKQVKSFIDQTFSNNKITFCSSGTFNGLSKHWKNIAYTKIGMDDYHSYLRAMSTSTKFYAISRFLLHNGF
jgi:hypothetical protein